nr:immunoglobulin heavy chain junction region [Mus musculus]
CARGGWLLWYFDVW